MLLRHSALYLVANGVSALLGFAAVFVFTRLLSPAEYAIVVLAMVAGTIMAALLFTWLRHAVLRFQADGVTDVRLTALTGYAAVLTLYPLAVVVAAFAGSMPWWHAAAGAAFAIGVTIYELGQEILRARQLPARILVMSTVRAILSFALCLLAVSLGGGGFAYVLMVGVAYGVASLAMSRTIWRPPLAPVDPVLLRTMLIYGAPISASGLILALYSTIDRIALAALAGPEVAGAYGATADLVRQCIIYPALSASLALAPIAVRALSSSPQELEMKIRDGFELLLALLLPAALGLAIVAPSLTEVLFGPQYRDTAAAVIPVVAFAWFFQCMSQQYVQLSFSLARKGHLFAWHTAAGLAIGLLLIVPMVKAWGAVGAASAMLIAEIGCLAAGAWLTRFAHPLPWPLGRSLRIAAAGLTMACATLLIRAIAGAPGLLPLLMIVATGIVCYALALVALDVLGARSHVQRLLRSARTRLAEGRP
jgi:O-antigen/teichoic acid export membrane protein